jgi:Flp pilus assembly protein TadD
VFALTGISQVILGVCVLLSQVGVQVGMRRWSLARLTRAWKAGHAALENDDLAAAEQAFRRCVKVMPMWPAGRTMLGVTLARAGMLPDAEEQLRFAADLEPKNPEGRLGLVYYYALYDPGNVQALAEAINAAVALAPGLREKLRGDPRLAGVRMDARVAAALAPPSASN